MVASKRIHTIVAPLDYGSRQGGASGGAARILELWDDIQGSLCKRTYIPREHNIYSANRIYELVRYACLQAELPFVIGGDHLLTCFSAAAVASVYPDLILLHFDAHHDAYTSAPLTHYSMMSVLNQKVEIIGRGYRWDIAKEQAVNRQLPPNRPVYVSLDVDYFSPCLIGGVGHSVPSHNPAYPGVTDLRHEIESLLGRIVALDICEWYGDYSSRTRHDSQTIDAVLKVLAANLSC